ncbi:MAG: HU family DNA-binding protein [Prevotella sp.]|nr:HU family DNA-binding protein [Prevotella sp.]
MNKQEIAAKLAARHGLSQKEAESFMTHLVDVLQDALKDEKMVKVKGLGTFKVTTVNPRASVDVNTGERIVIEGRDKITFTPETSMRDWVNRPFAQFETVVVNEGVNFDEIDAKYETTIDETVESAFDETPLVDIDIKDEEVPAVEPSLVVETSEVSEPSVVVETSEVSEFPEVSELSDNSDNSETPEPVEEAAVTAVPPIAPMAALVDVDDEPSTPEQHSNITDNPQTNKETMISENQNEFVNEEPIQDKVNNEEVAAQEEPAQEEPAQEEESNRMFDEYGYPTNEYQLREVKWQLNRSKNLVKILSGVIAGLVLLGGIGFFMLFREMSKKDARIDGLVAEVLDLSRKNTEANEENARMINVDDINLTAEQAAQLAEIRKQRRMEQQQRKKEIDDAYVKKMEDTRESVREQYRLREEQVAERMRREKDREQAQLDREAKDQAAKEKAAAEKAAKEKAVLEQLAREKAAKEKAAQEAAKQKAAQEAAAKQKAAQEAAAKQKAAQEAAAKAAAQKQQAQKQQQTAKPAGNSAAYNQDSRVRLGAYTITGVAQTVTVRQGQTLSSISKAYLGPGMECYVEAVNGGIKEVKPGQTLKIPALQLKKKQ